MEDRFQECLRYPAGKISKRPDIQIQTGFGDVHGFQPAGKVLWSSHAQRQWKIAGMDLSPFFFDPKYTKQGLINYKRDFVGAICFDVKSGILYVMEPLGEEDGRSIIHVFKVK